MQHEALIRLSFFFIIFLIVALCEYLKPKRKLKLKLSLRWSNNLALIVINTLILRLLFPVAAVGVALWCHINSLGILNYLKLSQVSQIIIAFILLDLTIYLQHLVFHYVPVLWRFHKVHHVDQDIDVTTGLRFHPVEIVLSMLIKFAVVALFGVPVLAVIIFEIALNATAMFNHANISLSKKLDNLIRLFIVTPDMHRVHHSTIVKETNSNFGFNLTIWDRVFRTYIDQPSKGHLAMDIGLKEYASSKMTQRLINMIRLPFLK